MKALIYGGTGFIGQHLVNGLLKQGYDVGCVTRYPKQDQMVKYYDFSDSAEYIINEFQPDVIYYLSASYSKSSIEDIVNVNITAPINILEYLSSHSKNTKFIYAGTYWQFGDADNASVPIDLYSSSKKAMESFFDYYNTYKGMSCIEVVFYGTFGVDDNRGKILDKLLDAFKSGKCIDTTEGDQELNLVDVEDIVINLIKLSKLSECSKYQLKSDENYSLKTIVDIINNYGDFHVNYGAIPYREVELMKISSCNRYKEIIVKDKIVSYIDSQLENKNVK
ncbi:Nucleoside-diphosphate-sugar epimerase [Vibrio chagasii]|nr:Nucleoside-diphosphate-sugar epimerase [Vibrio chagasii]CAH6988275.1 Nucleoside-diphosphate-sugar epimerase [Vibrio chagasii]CAH7011464.1 Nucleoside-diphosphate-sugar epimerase [Vibrio chagasii]